MGLIDSNDGYLKVKNFIEDEFKGDIFQYQEFHALIVEHAKRYYSKKPYGADDSLLQKFKVD